MLSSRAASPSGQVFRCCLLRQLLPPFGGFVFLVGAVVQIDEALNRFGQADLALGGDVGLVLFHAFVAGQEQRFGLGVFLLAEQAAAEQRLGVERGPVVRLFLLADRETLADERFGVGELLLFKQVQTECGQWSGVFRRVNSGLLFPERDQFPPERPRIPRFPSDTTLLPSSDALR